MGCSPETTKALVAMLMGLLAHTHSGDVVALAMMSAEQMAEEAEVSPAEWQRVLKCVKAYWKLEMRRNPISGMF